MIHTIKMPVFFSDGRVHGRRDPSVKETLFLCLSLGSRAGEEQEEQRWVLNHTLPGSGRLGARWYWWLEENTVFNTETEVIPEVFQRQRCKGCVLNLRSRACLYSLDLKKKCTFPFPHPVKDQKWVQGQSLAVPFATIPTQPSTATNSSHERKASPGVEVMPPPPILPLPRRRKEPG